MGQVRKRGTMRRQFVQHVMALLLFSVQMTQRQHRLILHSFVPNNLPDPEQKEGLLKYPKMQLAEIKIQNKGLLFSSYLF